MEVMRFVCLVIGLTIFIVLLCSAKKKTRPFTDYTGSSDTQYMTPYKTWRSKGGQG